MASHLNTKREYLPQLQIVRAIAIIGVIAVHASASATITMKDSSYYMFYSFLNTIMRFGTPTFILLSSFVLFYSYYDRKIDKKLIIGFYKKRLLYIIIPYLIFSAFYYLYLRHWVGQPLFNFNSWSGFWQAVLYGKAAFHLYFIFISIQFYLLFPIILWLVKRWKPLVHWLIPLGFVIQWAFVLINLYALNTPDKGSWSLTYFSFFLLGAALGIYYPKIKDWIIISKQTANKYRVSVWLFVWAGWLVMTLSHAFVYYNARMYGTRYDALLYEFLWHFHSLFSALVIIQAAYLIYQYMPSWITRAFYRLGQLSFGVYLIHAYFLLIYDKHKPNFGTASLAHLTYLGSFVFMLAASWIVVALVSRYLPFSWVLFGKVEKPNKTIVQRKPASPKSRRLKVIIAGTAVLLIGAAIAAGAWYKLNKTANFNDKQELLAIASVSDIADSYDVIVAGTDPEGVAAAVSAARNGLSVLLIDGKDREILGGLMTVGGLNTLDLNYSPKKSVIPGKHNFLNKGIFQEWYNQVEGTSFDTNTAANAFYRMVQAEPNIHVQMKLQHMEPIVEQTSDANVIVKGMRLTMPDGTQQEVAASSIIDATQDGDIAAMAGAPFTFGREDIGNKNARMAVTLVFAMSGVTQQIWDSFAQHKQTGIDAMSAWGFPDAKDYVSSNPERVKMRGLNIGRQNDETILINAMHIYDVDPLDPASVQEALEIGRAEAPRIVDYLKETFVEMKNLEFAYTVDELYIRESRHFEGEYRLTMADVLNNRDHWDAIAYGSYSVDIQSASHTDSGYVLMAPVQYGVPFRSLVPLQVDGLLVVGRAASFDTLPHGSARVIPLGMATAEAAGAAAKLTFRELSQSKELIQKLQENLMKQGMDLTYHSFEAPYYMNHKAYKGLMAAASTLIASGDYNNLAFGLDLPSNPQRIVYSMGRIKETFPEFFTGEPSTAIAGMAAPDTQQLSAAQAVKTISHAVTSDEAQQLTVDGMLEKGWITSQTLSSITNQEAITNGEFFMLLRDVLEFYVGIVYE